MRICPEPTHWGGLSGCTYSEGVSWGKFVPPSEGGRFGEVFVDATVGLPIIRTSVDHGTAFDIAGKGIADEKTREVLTDPVVIEAYLGEAAA